MLQKLLDRFAEEGDGEMHESLVSSTSTQHVVLSRLMLRLFCADQLLRVKGHDRCLSSSCPGTMAVAQGRRH